MKPINLLPPEVVALRQARRLGTTLTAVFGGLILSLGIIWLVFNWRINQQEERRQAAEAKAQVLTSKINALSMFATMEQAIKSKTTTLQGALTNDVGWSRLLKQISDIIPANSYLTAFQGTTEGAAGAAPAPVPAPAPPPGAPAGAPTGPAGAAPAPAAGTGNAPGQAAPAPAARLGSITFTVVTFDFPGVAQWITTLEATTTMQNIFMSNAAKEDRNGREVVNFSSSADLTPEARSRRYQPDGAP